MAKLCAPGMEVQTLRSIASVESSFNPFAIGVVGARLQRQPVDLAEAVATSRALTAQGYDYSLGLVQINQKNFAAYGLTIESALDPCNNLRVGGLIFQDCFRRAGASRHVLGDALSCYYSGNFKTGYRHGYVAKVLAAGGISGGVGFPRAVPIGVRAGRASGRRDIVSQPRASDPIFLKSSLPIADPVTSAGSLLKSHASAETALLF